ncbi:MAG: adenylate/guanylate cyclase domain-containing protein [Candidatus Nanopelagicales bacterium]
MTPRRIAPAASAAPAAASNLAGRLLGASPLWDGAGVAAEVGTEPAQIWLFWRALGLPPPPDEQTLFTDSDVATARAILDLVQRRELSPGEALEIVRGVGQTTARLAEWMVEALTADSGDPEAHNTRLVELLPAIETLLLHGWRRHLLAALERSQDAAPDPVLSIGFADIAGFTTMSRLSNEADLTSAVVAFETIAADTVTAAGARLIKTVGDEVMFAADTPLIAAMACVALHAGDASGALPLRVGLATGSVIAAMGDLYGDTVNLAARLTGMARPGATLIDPATAEALRGCERFRLRQLSQRRIPGLGLLSPSSLRSANA